MKIHALEVEGFGVWNGLKIDGLSDGLNVFYGPNEAGKTTLMQFVRSMFYGFSPERRRYLPPLHGGQPGGSVHVAGPHGRFRVSRYDNGDRPGEPERLTLTAADGTRQGEHFLKNLLYDVDEKIYNNVFAVGLRELQELATLSNTEAASLLYNLSIGLDRVSLVDVMRELTASRNRLLDGQGGSCQISQLMAERERLRNEIEESGSLGRRQARLAAEQEVLNREIARWEQESAELQNQVRTLQLAGALRERWQRRSALRAEVAALTPAGSIPEGVLEKLDAIRQRIESRQQRLEAGKQRRARLREEQAELKVNDALWRLAPRVEALQEQESWIGTLGTRIEELELETVDLESQLEAQCKRFGLAGPKGGAMPAVSPQTLIALHLPGRGLRRVHARVQEAEEEELSARQAAESLAAQIQAALDARGLTGLSDAVDRSGSMVSQLRRRAQLDERIKKLEGYRAELEQKNRHLLARQLMPMSWVLGLGAFFVAGVVLALAGLFMHESIIGPLGWLIAIPGLLAAIAAVVIRVVMERSNTRQLEACQNQTNMLHLQIKHAKQEREQLDREMPGVKGAVGVKLKAAEDELAGLEQLVPLDSQRQAALQEAEAAARRAAQSRTELESARRRWRDAVAALGLPKDLTPKQVKELAACCEQTAELQRSLASRREELEQRRRELAGVTGRIAQLAAETGVAVPGDNPVEQLRELARQVGQQAGQRKRRDALRKLSRRLRRRRMKVEADLNRARRRRRELLRRAGAATEEELRLRVEGCQRTASLRMELETIEREIHVALAGHCSEDALCDLLEGPALESLASRCAALEKKLQVASDQLRERFEKRGRLDEQARQLAQDRSAIARHFELNLVEKRLDDAVHRWQVLAVTSRVLDTIRATYERERQPETLQEASVYLERLTQGRYARVWTPFGQQILLVESPEGESIPVESLSEGSREQLFLCLRLALAGSYARRGASLPMVLDDVLVNYDQQRAKAAAGVLRDFADTGHQLLVFTCHEHLARLFKSLRIDVRTLPGHTLAEETPAEPAPAPAPKRSRRSRVEPTPHKLVAREVEPPAPPVEEEPSDQEEEEVTQRDIPWEEGDSVEPDVLADEEEEDEDADEYDDPEELDDAEAAA